MKLVPGRQANTTLELLFFTEDLPPLGLLSYHIERSDGGVTPSMQKMNLTLLINNTNMTAPLETSQEAPEDIEVDNGVSIMMDGRLPHGVLLPCFIRFTISLIEKEINISI